MNDAVLSPLLQEVLDAARQLTDHAGRPDYLPHAIEVCLHHHPNGPFTPNEVAHLRAIT